MSLLKRVKQIAFKTVNFCFSVFPVKRNRIFFVSFYGKSYSDNPKAISKALYELFGDKYEHVWVLDNLMEEVPNYIRICKSNTMKMLYYMSTSKVWVSNFLLPKGTYKRKTQFYIQTWHGDKAFKKILHDVPSRDGRAKWLFETNNVDLMIAGSEYGVRQIRTAFLYNGEILRVGTPRNDLFFKDNQELKDSIRKAINCTGEEKIIIYAPTFRRDDNGCLFDAHFDFNKVLRILGDSTGCQWKILIRAHSADKRIMKKELNGNAILDVSNYPDMNELLLISDMLITDYSSVAGDYALLGKPVLLYQYDKEHYLAKDRDLYFDMKESPYNVVYNEEELYRFLSNVNSVNIKQNCKDILSFYKDFETGNASSTLAYLINSL